MSLIKSKYIKRGKGLIIEGEDLSLGLSEQVTNLGIFVTQAMIDDPGSIFIESDLNKLYIPDAPLNDVEYVRKNGAWAPSSSSTSIENVDGGHPDDIYTTQQIMDGGDLDV